MSEFSKLFFPDTEPVIKTTFTCSDKDYQLVKVVYPEYGFLQYFPGLFFHLLAQELRKREIKNAYDRLSYPELATVPGLLSDLNLAFDPSRRRHVGRATGSVRKEPAHLQRILADLAQSSPPVEPRHGNEKGKEESKSD